MFVRVQQCVDGYRIEGELHQRIDLSWVLNTVLNAEKNIVEGRQPLLLHDDATTASSSQEYTQRLQAIAAGRSKRYAFKVATPHEMLIVKIAKPQTWYRRLAGTWGVSVSKTEHRLQQECEKKDLAAAQSLGFLHIYQGYHLEISCQIQTCVALSMLPYEQHEHSIHVLARELARLHQVSFFHADLKPYHMYISNLDPFIAKYIDLGRVSFYITPRKRIINLYQVLRFFLQNSPEKHFDFVQAYCHEAHFCEPYAVYVYRYVRWFLERKQRQG